MAMHPPNEYRRPHPIYQSMGKGNDGYFVFTRDNIWFYCLSSDGMGWEHVSVSISKKRCPTWEEMCMVKDLFWDEQDTVIQYHPAKDDYVNMHPRVLHLWRPREEKIPVPNSIMVGLK